VRLKAILVDRHSLLFFSTLYVVYVSVLFFRCELSDSTVIGHDLVRLIAPSIELGLVSLMCAACLRKARQGARFAWLTLGSAIAGTAAVTYFAQTVSLYLSNNFITVLALRNTESTGFINSPSLRILGIVAVAGFGLFVYCMARLSAANPVAPEKQSNKSLAVGLLGLVALNLWLVSLQQKRSNLEAAFWQAPVASLAHSVFIAWLGHETLEDDRVSGADGKHCFSYPRNGLDNGSYPFQKAFVYTSALPFAPVGRIGRKGGPNIIVVFTEGTSARLIGAYGGAYPGLTPNIDRLAARSMRVENYFNHTAPTYRGLIGQLSSGYAYADGGGDDGWERGDNKSSLSAIRRQTLPQILDEHGYDSYFFSPHVEDRPFTIMLQSLGFDEVYTYESIGKGLLKGHFRARANTGALEDQSLFAGLAEFLRQRATNGDDKPFFLAMYNIGTHAFIDINKKDDVAYRDGNKPFLNKLHNYDAALGEFLNYFYASPFAENTIFVFTADHAAYPDLMYRAVAGKDLKPYFFDRIPLLIHDPIHHLSGTFDAQGRNSLDLAPTTLHLLGVSDAPNSFLGRSLFEPRNFPLGIAAEGSAYFLTTSKGVFAEGDVPQLLKSQFDCEIRVVHHFYVAEHENRLFRPISMSAPHKSVRR
jgi:lipoteichoic acid synthase